MNHNTIKKNRSTPLHSEDWQQIKLECKPSTIRKIWLAQDWVEVERALNKENRNDELWDRFGMRPDQLIYRLKEQFPHEPKEVPQNRHKRVLINRMAGYCGVQHLGQMYGAYAAHVYALATGDVYDTTLIFRGRNLSIGSVGELAESDSRKMRWADLRAPAEL